MPAWLEALARWNPLSLVANGLREALLLGQMPDAANLLPLLAIGAFLFALASRTMTVS
jgi:ABC-type polysaccharide/polyol phosphate export permease